MEATQIPVMIYTEATPNPNTLKFVTNKALLLNDAVEFQSVKDADEALRDLRSLGIKFHEVDWDLTRVAAAYKTKGGISYADCFAAALAKHNKAALVTGDKEFKQLEDEISIVWLW